MSTEELRKQVEAARQQLHDLENELRRVERKDLDERWFPQGFYTAYHVLSGCVLGMIAAWCTLLFNMIGAAACGESPLKLLRVYSTFLGPVTATARLDAVVLILALGMHTLTGAVCGAPIHVVYSRFLVRQRLMPRLLTGVFLGAVMWIVNFYGILIWLQPLVTGEGSSYIVDNVPAWVAFLTHVAFAEVVVLLQPLGMFNARNYPGTGNPGASARS